jgi:hypothetical protein
VQLLEEYPPTGRPKPSPDSDPKERIGEGLQPITGSTKIDKEKERLIPSV